ncbi:hypothetical protein AB4Y32_34595 [Paraburkholderia phymatum]|uniref:Uncharacterized protein n=1 Tax=Paraburkholderia phymatum TaxID=148447 RepID=A0ACC6UB79_9BURK
MTADVADRVVLFSGHMIDAPGRPVERFPARLVPRIARAIGDELDVTGAGCADIGLCGAACGSDLLFAVAALERHMTLRIHLPFDETAFIERSVAIGGERWVELYRRVSETATCIVADDVLGPLPPGADPFTRNNLLMLSEARRIGARAFTFVCVWDGQPGDGPGGTEHLASAVRAAHGEVRIIDIRAFADAPRA